MTRRKFWSLCLVGALTFCIALGVWLIPGYFLLILLFNSHFGPFSEIPMVVAWPVAALAILGVPSLVAYFTVVRRRAPRQEQHLCSHCGYDLRAADSDRCPECGTPITGEAAPTTG